MKYITRKKKSNKFIYVDEKNVEIKNKDILNKISKIYIAPAYTDVRIFPNSNDLLAYGYDDAGRKQYVYSESFKLKRESQKLSAPEKVKNTTEKVVAKPLNNQKQIEKIEQQIFELENKKSDIENKMAQNSDFDELKKLELDLKSVQVELNKITEEWEALIE